MFPLGHLGLTLAAVDWGWGRHVRFPLDYRILLVGALLPDFIDKPLSLALGVGGRNVAHTLVFVLVLTLLAVVVRSGAGPADSKGAWAAALVALALGSGSHLLLDRMWALPEVLLWPFLGLGFPLDPFDPINFLEGYQDLYVLIGDVLGGLALSYLAMKKRIYRRANFTRFLRTGHPDPGQAPLTPTRRE